MAKSSSVQKTPLALTLAASEIPIAQLTRDPELSCRVKGCNPKIIGEYTSRIQTGAVFPPVTAFRDADGVTWLADGFHRVAAHEAAGRDDIAIDLRDGSRLDALAFAAQANTGHGLRRTTADKRRAVVMLLAARPDWSDRQIADSAAVDHKTVASVRRASTGEIPQLTRQGADGKTRRVAKVKRGRPKAPRAVRALRPFAKALERVAKGHPEAAAEIERVSVALLDLVAKLSPPDPSLSQAGLIDNDSGVEVSQ